ncbi:MAG: sulfate/molybdate ABC transporter ATP-binding protein [Gemmiger sp.]
MSLQVEIHKTLGDFTLDVAFETDSAHPEVLGLLGVSGCGKSCTLQCIAGIQRPDRGRIVLDGVTLFDSEKKIDLPPQRRQVGYLFQHYALFPHMTVRQNILCGLHREKNRAARQAEVQRVLALLQLEGLENHRPAQLSGGQAQRVALARILVTRPRLLLLDEPFSALDSHLRDRLQLELKTLLAELGRPALLVTHSRDEAYHLCRRIAVLDGGRLLTVKDTKALFADPGSVRAALLTGRKNIAAARRVGEREVEVPDWGIRLQTDRPVGEGLKAVGIRAHDLNPRAVQNRAGAECLGEMEEPFEWIVEFRWANQAAGCPPLWWRVPKDRRTPRFPDAFGVAPANVLLLYD